MHARVESRILDAALALMDSDERKSAALKGESHMPSLCYSLNARGMLWDFIELERNYRENFSLFLGEEFFIPSNFKHPCIMRMIGKIALVRRAIVLMEPRSYGAPIPTLAQPDDGNPPLLLHVNPTFTLPSSAKLKEEFWSGIRTDATIAAKDKFGTHMLVAFDQEGQYVELYVADGRVIRVVREGAKLKLQTLTLEDQATLRIRYALEGIERTRSNSQLVKEEQVRKIDRFYHQIVAVMAIGGARQENILSECFDILSEAARRGEIRAGVRAHAYQALQNIAPAMALQFGVDCEAAKLKRSSGGAFGHVLTQHVDDARRGPPLERQKKLQERRARDAAARAARRGSSQEKPLSQGKKAKGKK